jgi:HprK-related kinase A
LIVADLDAASIRRQLAGDGLCVRTGPLVSRIRSRLEVVADGLSLHYAGHPLLDSQDFADFDVRVDRPKGLRRWFNPQVVFTYDDTQPFTPLPGSQGFPLLEWGMNWCVYNLCDQYLTMHSAVLERNGLAVIMPAPSGSGKSTLCAGLAFRGWRLLSDELAVVDPKNGLLVPIPRPISLKNRSIEVIRSFAPEAVFGAPVTDTLKGTVCHVRPPAGAVAQAEVRARPRWVIFPKYVADARAVLKPMTRARTFMELTQQCFNYSIHGRQGFRVLADLVSGCEGYEFTYGRLDEAIAVFNALSAEAQPSH